jgi:hypothetical protein
MHNIFNFHDTEVVIFIKFHNIECFSSIEANKQNAIAFDIVKFDVLFDVLNSCFNRYCNETVFYHAIGIIETCGKTWNRTTSKVLKISLHMVDILKLA